MTTVIKISRRPDGTFLAWCPALPGCSTRGQTHQEARKRLQDAIGGYLASLNAAVPERLQLVETVP